MTQAWSAVRQILVSFRTLPGTYAMMSWRRSKEAKYQAERRRGGFIAVVDQVIALLRQWGHGIYDTRKRQFQLDDAALEEGSE